MTGWLYWALLAAAFAALTAIFAKVGVADVDPDAATLIRTAVVLVTLSFLVAASGKWHSLAGANAKTWGFLFLSGLATGASWLCYFRALKLGQAFQVAPIDKLSVVLVALFAFAFLNEKPSLREWSGIALIALGALVMAIKR